MNRHQRVLLAIVAIIFLISACSNAGRNSLQAFASKVEQQGIERARARSQIVGLCMQKAGFSNWGSKGSIKPPPNARSYNISLAIEPSNQKSDVDPEKSRAESSCNIAYSIDHPANPQAEYLQLLQDRTEIRMIESPEYRTIERDWSRCMAVKGYRVESQSAIVQGLVDVANRISSGGQVAAPMLQSEGRTAVQHFRSPELDRLKSASQLEAFETQIFNVDNKCRNDVRFDLRTAEIRSVLISGLFESDK